MLRRMSPKPRPRPVSTSSSPQVRRRRVVVDESALAQQIGARIKAARLAAGLTQQQLADGRYTKAYVSALENGLSKPSMAALNFLAARLGLPSSKFLEDQPAGWTRLAADLELAAGRWDQAVDAYRSLLDHETDRARRAELLLGLAEGLAGLDRGHDAAAAAAEAAQLFGTAGRDAEAALANYWLSCGEYQQGNTSEARAILEAILSKVRAGLKVEPDFQVRVLMALSSNASQDGEHQSALAYLSEIRGLSEFLDDRRRGVYYFDLAHSYRETGDYEAAIRTGMIGLALLHAAQAEYEWAGLQNGLARSYLALGNTARAQEAVAGARAVFERLGDRRWLSYVTEAEAQIALAQGDTSRAGQLAAEALRLAEETSDQKGIMAALLTLGHARAKDAAPDDVMGLYERAVDLALREGKPARIRDVLGEYADVLAAQGQHERALEIMRRALKAG